MKVLYIDCPMGIAGDMMLAALVDAGANRLVVLDAVASLKLEGVDVSFSEVMKGDFRAISLSVVHPEQHAHRHLADVQKLLADADITERARAIASELFAAVAVAEATVHGTTPDRVHFHEVGAIDSIVDILGVAVAFDSLAIDRVVGGPVPTGFGLVDIDHGTCPIPAPGTAELLRGIPLRDTPVEMELTTPTGAAIAKVLVDDFGRLPEMTIDHVGHGAGNRDVPGRANILRLFVGEAVQSGNTDEVILLETNLDDVTGEVVGYTKQKLMDSGALDAYSTPIQMKKDRPGVVLSVMSRPAVADKLEEILFAETGTLGVRRSRVLRSVRPRQASVVETAYGRIAVKIAPRAGYEPEISPEFESCAAAAAEHQVPIRHVYRAARAADAPKSVSTPKLPSHDHSHDHSHSHDHDHTHDHS